MRIQWQRRRWMGKFNNTRTKMCYSKSLRNMGRMNTKEKCFQLSFLSISPTRFNLASQKIQKRARAPIDLIIRPEKTSPSKIRKGVIMTAVMKLTTSSM